MKILRRLSALALTAVSVPFAQTTLEPYMLHGYGSTLFRFEFTEPVTPGDPNPPPDNTDRLAQSELEYPLDVFVAGLRFKHGFRMEGERSVGLILNAWTSISAPEGKMQDSDWFGIKSSSVGTTETSLFKFSYTQSRAELHWFGGEAGLDFGYFHLLDKPIRYGLLVHADWFSYRMFGAEGWQRLPDQPAQAVDFAPDSLVLTYKLVRIMPRLFADMTLIDHGAFAWNAALSAAPAFATDHDDHVLRKKQSDSFAAGFELGILTELHFRLSDHFGLSAAADLRYLRTKGELDQKFYGDDPGTPNDETGLGFKNLVTRIIGFGGGLSLGAGYFF